MFASSWAVLLQLQITLFSSGLDTQMWVARLSCTHLLCLQVGSTAMLTPGMQ